MTGIVIGWLATYALHSTFLLGGVLLLARRLPSDAWRETAWKAALVGGLVTASIQGVTTTRPLAGRWALPDRVVAAAPAVAAEPLPEVAPELAADRSALESAALQGVDVDVPAPPAAAGRAEGDATARGGLGNAVGRPGASWLLAAWLAGALVLLGRVALRHHRLARLLRGRWEVREARVLRVVAELRRSDRVARPVRVTASGLCPTPLALRGGEICIPERLLALPEAEQRSALAHEMAHVLRRDPEWQLATSVIEAIFFFQPLNRAARRALREAAEHQCDDWAVRRTGSPLALARCLMEVAVWVSADRRLPRAVPAMAESGSPLVRRVERLLAGAPRPEPPRFGARLAAAACLIASTAVAAPAVSPLEVAFQARVIAHPTPAAPLAEKLGWAVREASRRGDPTRWIAWSFERTFPAGTYVVMEDSEGWGSEELTRDPLGRLLFGAGWRAPAQGSGPTRQPLIVLLHLRGDAIDRVAVRSASLGIDSGDPIYWLGVTDQGQSFDWLVERAGGMATATLEGVTVEAISLHEETARVVPYLEGVIRSTGPASVREEAVEGLVWHPTARSVAILREVALGDDVRTLRAEAAESLGEVDIAAADAALLEVIASSAPIDVRREAVEAMGEGPSPRAAAELERIALQDRSEDLQAEAVETLGDLATTSVTPLLARIARTHASLRIREEAMETLAEVDSTFAARLLVEIVDDRGASLDAQRRAVEAMEDLPEATARPLLARIARDHPRAEVRAGAREVLRDLVSSR